MTEKKRTNAEKIALATNTAGAIAGPAAIYQAVQNARRNEGGMPRQITMDMTNPKTKTGAKLAGTRAGRGARRVAVALKNPKNKYVRGTAIGLGGLSVGLQGANWAGDTIAARMISQQSGKEQKVTKRYDDNGFTKFSGGGTARGTGVGVNISKRGNYEDMDAYNTDRVRRAGRGETYGALGTAGLFGGGAAAVAGSGKGGLKGFGQRRNAYVKHLKNSKSSKYKLGGGLAALAAAPVAAAATKRFSRESKQDWT